MGGISLMAHLFSLVIFVFLIFKLIELQKRLRLAKQVLSQLNSGTGSRVLVASPSAILTEIAPLLDFEFHSDVSGDQPPQGKIDLKPLLQFWYDFGLKEIRLESNGKDGFHVIIESKQTVLDPEQRIATMRDCFGPNLYYQLRNQT